MHPVCICVDAHLSAEQPEGLLATFGLIQMMNQENGALGEGPELARVDCTRKLQDSAVF